VLFRSTGVANGYSTKTILKALELNGGHGKLVSMDVNENCKNVSPTSTNWDFIHLNDKHARSDMLSASRNLGAVDIWIHDSDHSKYWQTLEFDLAISKLAPQGMLISDDIDSSTAWIDLISKIHVSSHCMFDGNRAIGFLQND
jgi:predicted O-methyltransferase YrrM